MYNKNKKRGFTIVELVIVIAVIAILAGVLIPTFASVVKKANRSSDIAAVDQMNKALVGSDCKTLDEALKVLLDNGFNSDDTLVPVSKDHTFQWNKNTNKVVLVDGDGKYVAPAKDKMEDTFAADVANGVYFNLRLAAVKVELPAADAADAAKVNEALKDGQSIKLTAVPEKFTTSNTSSEKIDGRQVGIVVPTDAVVTIDLGGQTLEAESDTVALAVQGEARITNGTIGTRSIVVEAGAKLVLEGDVVVNATAADGGACIRNLGGTVIINGGTYNAIGGDNTTDIGPEPGCIYSIGTVIINGGTFNCDSSCYAIQSSGNITINEGVTVVASRGAIAINGGVATINGGNFTVKTITTANPQPAYCVYFAGAEHSTVTINGGTFVNEYDAAGAGLFGGATTSEKFVDAR